MELHCMGTPAQRRVENALKAVRAECGARAGEGGTNRVSKRGEGMHARREWKWMRGKERGQ